MATMWRMEVDRTRGRVCYSENIEAIQVRKDAVNIASDNAKQEVVVKKNIDHVDQLKLYNKKEQN